VEKIVWRRAEGRHERVCEALRRAPSAGRGRVLAIGAWTAPVYSHTFVYQELSALADAGFEVRLCRSRRGPARELPSRLAPLAPRLVGLEGGPGAGRRGFERWRRRAPRRVDDLLAELAGASGLDEASLLLRPAVLRAFLFAELAEAWRADYLHSYFFYEGSLAAHVAARLLDLPRGVSCYADHLLADDPLKVVALHLAAADLLVATSERVAGELRGLAPDTAPRILVKPNAIDCRHFPVRPLRDRGGRRGLLAVCRIDAKKGLPDAVAALAALVAEGRDVELEIAGTADAGAAGRAARRELLGAIRENRLDERVRLLGRCDEAALRRAHSRADLFVVPSVELPDGDKDGIPTALLEAMASGLPVVATTAGSIAEAVRHAEEGWLVPPGRPAELAAAIGHLFDDGELADRLRRAAASAARERFDIAVCEPRLHARIGQLLAERRGARASRGVG
jgi:glycosyltransferase involved in cell wall biosynthesis